MKPTIYFQALNEVENFGEWSGVQESGDTIDLIEGASYPYRGKYGLRVVCVEGGDYAYAYKTGLGISIAAGKSIFLSFAQKFENSPSAETYVLKEYNSDNSNFLLLAISDSGKGRLWWKDDGGTWDKIYSNAVLAGKWHWITIEIRRATSSTAADGYAKLYVDEVEDVIAENIDNYDRWATLNYFNLGVSANSQAGFVIDFDEVILADKMVRPPLPAGKVWK